MLIALSETDWKHIEGILFWAAIVALVLISVWEGKK